MAGNWNSGKRPQPNRLKVLRGNPGRRPLNKREPLGEPVTEAYDTPPRRLQDDVEACAEWSRLAPLLRKAGMVSQEATAALLALCQQWSRYLDLMQKARQSGNYGGVDKALGQCLRLWQEFGLTPSSRSRLIAMPAAAPAKEEKWAGLI